MVCPPTMAGPESLVRGSLFRACRLAMVSPPLEATSQNQTTSVAETLARTRSIQNSVTQNPPLSTQGRRSISRSEECVGAVVVCTENLQQDTSLPVRFPQIQWAFRSGEVRRQQKESECRGFGGAP